MVIADPKYDFPRNLVGYGQDGVDCQWPNGARIALSICVNYEEGAELTVLNGDAHSETFNWEKAGGEPLYGVRHTNVESDYEYGSRAGIWRLLRIFSAFPSYHFTLSAVGRALELHPGVAPAVAAAGHEIAGHGYRWLDYRDFAPADEKAHVHAAIGAITRAAGRPPRGWFAGRGSPNSVGVVLEAFAEAGLELKWEADAFNDDAPYWVDVPPALRGAGTDEGLLILPYAYDSNDMKFAPGAGTFGGGAWDEYLRDAFDMLYAEGGRMMSVGVHPRITGKAGRARMLQRFLEYVSAKEGVWVATREEIADHFRRVRPYPGRGKGRGGGSGEGGVKEGG